MQVCVLQALRNLSFGRANNENKLQIVGNAGLQEMMVLLKNSSNPTVRELVTNVLWNLSSSEVSDEEERGTQRDGERKRERETERKMGREGRKDGRRRTETN